MLSTCSPKCGQKSFWTVCLGVKHRSPRSFCYEQFTWKLKPLSAPLTNRAIPGAITIVWCHREQSGCQYIYFGRIPARTEFLTHVTCAIPNQKRKHRQDTEGVTLTGQGKRLHKGSIWMYWLCLRSITVTYFPEHNPLEGRLLYYGIIWLLALAKVHSNAQQGWLSLQFVIFWIFYC